MPLARPDVLITLPGKPVTFHPLDNDDATAAVIIGLSAPGFGTVVHNADQSLTYTPNAGFVGADAFTYTLADAVGASAEGSVTVIVDSLPVAVDDTVTTMRGTAIVIPAVANDNDPDADPLTIVSVSSPGHGSVDISPDQTLRYQPQQDFTGVDSFTYTVMDGRGLQASAVVGVAVIAPDHAPCAVADHAATGPATAATLDLLANDQDPDGDPLTLVGLTLPEHGTVAVNADSSVTYRPAAGFTGEDRFTYTVADGQGASASAEASIDVVRANQPPRAAAVAAVTPAGVAVTVSPLGQTSDPDGDPVRLTALTLPAHGRLAVNPDQTVTYTPAAGYSGEEEFSYTVEDDRGASAVGSVRIDVQPPPAQPVFANGYAYRRRIVVSARPATGEPSEGFVARIDECATWLRTQTQGGRVQSAAGFDLRFELEDGTRLAHEIELYDGAAGRLLAWLRVPGWSLSQQLRLFLYYGKAGLAASEADPAAAWTDYLAVWNTRSGVDRSGHGHHLTPGALENAELIGPAAHFPGSAVATLADASWCAGQTALTVQCWAKAEAAAIGSDRGLLDQGTRGSGGDSGQGMVLRYAGTGYRGGAAAVVVWNLQTSAGCARLESAANAQDTTARMVHAVWRSGELPRLHIDGVATAASWVGAVVNNVATAGHSLTGTTVASGGLALGAGSTGGDAGAWLGLIDEMRLRAGAPSPARIAAEYASQADPRAFYGIGDGDDPTTGASSVALPLAVSTSAGARTDIDVLAQAYVPAGAAAPSILSVTQPGNGLATIVSGKARYTPNAGFAGVDSFTYTVGAGSKTSTARITVAVAALAPELPVPLRTVNVGTYAQLQAALAAACPGDQIVLASGIYSGATLTLRANGTAAAPIVVKAATKNQAEIRCTMAITGNYLLLWGLKFTGDTGKVTIGGNYDSVLRCEFTGWRPKHAIELQGGGHAQVRYCYIHNPGTWSTAELTGNNALRINIRFTGTLATFHTGARISHCLIKDTLQRPRPGDYASGQADFIEIGESVSDYPGLNSQTTIESCLFDGNEDPKASGIVDIKVGGVTVKNCTFKNAAYGRLDNRGGRNSSYLSNYFNSDTNGMAVWCGGHVVGGNVLESGPKIQIGVGTEEWDQYLPGEYQRPKNILCVSNTGLLKIGSTGPGDANATLPADCTRVEDHRGACQTQVNYSGTWDTPTAGLLEQNTSWAAAASIVVPIAVELGETDVGLNAPWVP